MTDSPPIDVQRLRSTFDDDAVLAELYAMYLEDTALRLAELTSALISADADRCRHTAHTVKGSSANIGATRMHELSGRLEKMDTTADPAGAQALCAELHSEFARVTDFLHAFLAAVPQS